VTGTGAATDVVNVATTSKTKSGKSQISPSVTDTSTSPHSTKPHNPHPITAVDPYFYSNPEDMVDASFQATAPQPTPGTPYLQSGRLFPPAIGGHVGLNKQTLKQMDAILKELGVPVEPIATKRSMDLYDGVRKDALTLLVLQKVVMKKEAEVISKRTKLIKLKGEAAAAEISQVEKKDTEKKQTAKNRAAKAESRSLTKQSGGVVALSPSGELPGGPRSTPVISGGVKKAAASGGGIKSAKAPKRQIEDSTTSSGVAPIADSVGVTTAPTGKSSGKKGPGITGRKKPRKSVSSGSDAKKGNKSTSVPKAGVHLESAKMPMMPPALGTAPIPHATVMTTSAASGTVHPNQLAVIAPAVNPPAADQPSTAKSITPTASHGSLPISAPLPTLPPVSSPGKTTGKKRSKKSS